MHPVLRRTTGSSERTPKPGTSRRRPPARRRASFLLVAVVTLGTGGRVAVADGPPDDARPRGDAERITAPGDADASALFARGSRHAGEGRYREALEAWTRAYFLRLPELRGLTFRRPVESRFLPREALREFLVEKLAEEYPDERIAADAAAYAHLGFFAPGTELRELYLRLLTAEIAGFYDPATDELRLIADIEQDATGERSLWKRIFGGEDDFDPAEQRMILAHEMAHALADQHFDLDALMHEYLADDDRVLAASAVVEGEAMVVMMLDQIVPAGASAQATQRALGDVYRMTGFIGGINSALAFFGGTPAFRRAPLVLREALLFPYTAGLDFCAHGAARGGWEAVRRAFREPPRSTEQILHPEKYFGPEPDEPVALAFGEDPPLDPAAWTFVKENGLGEFGIEVLLRPAHGKPASAKAAAGWDGDVFRLWRASEEDDGASTLLVWSSVWDGPEEAAEFVDALVPHLEKRDRERGRVPERLDPAAEGVPGAEALWSAEGRRTAVVRDGAEVRVVDGAPPGALGPLLAWSARLESGTKPVALPAATTEPGRGDGAEEGGAVRGDSASSRDRQGEEGESTGGSAGDGA